MHWPRNVWILGLAALLNDVASEMVFPLLPVFLAGLGPHAALALGAMDGIAELVSSGLKWASGVAADRRRASRPFVIGGYAFAALARPLFALATAPWHVIATRALDRVGKGLRTAPRDAMLAASVPEAQRGAAFGVHRAMDHLGAAIGPLLAAAILWAWTEDVRTVFAVATVPGLLAAAVVFATRDPGAPPPPAHRRTPSPNAWRLLVPIGVATLGTASDSFLLFKIGVEQDAPPFVLPLFWMALHVVRSAATGPAGWLADRIEPRTLLAFGWLWRAALFAALSRASDPSAVVALAVGVGLAALTEPAERKLVGAHAVGGRTGAAFGTYHALVGAMALPAGLWFGAVADQASVDIAYSIAAAVLVLATGFLAVLRPRGPDRT